MALLTPGQELDRFVIERQLSGGKFSETYVISHRNAPIEHILKINLRHDEIRPKRVQTIAREYDAEERTENELSILAELDHPNIAKPVDLIELPGGHQGIVLQKVGNARTLREIITQDKRGGHAMTMPEERYYSRVLSGAQNNWRDNTFQRVVRRMKTLESLVPQVKEIIWYLAKHHITHRDIKPENLMIDNLNHLTVIDFGLAQKEEEAKDELVRRSTIEYTEGFKRLHLRGSVLYKGPKNLCCEELQAPLDTWSWGASLLELIDGQPIIPGSRSAVAAQIAAMEMDETAVRTFLDSLDERIRNITQRVTALCDIPDRVDESRYGHAVRAFWDGVDQGQEDTEGIDAIAMPYLMSWNRHYHRFQRAIADTLFLLTAWSVEEALRPTYEDITSKGYTTDSKGNVRREATWVLEDLANGNINCFFKEAYGRINYSYRGFGRKVKKNKPFRPGPPREVIPDDDIPF